MTMVVILVYGASAPLLDMLRTGLISYVVQSTICLFSVSYPRISNVPLWTKYTYTIDLNQHNLPDGHPSGPHRPREAGDTKLQG